jgi:hypothetical protein
MPYSQSLTLAVYQQGHKQRESGEMGVPRIVDVASQDIPRRLDKDQQCSVTTSPYLCLKTRGLEVLTK